MRNTLDIQITDEGRDKGKWFRITEMDADDGEEWAYQFLLTLAKAGATVPDPSMGMAGVAIAAMQAVGSLDFPQIKPLLDRMFQYVQRVPDMGNANILRPLVKDDTEEITTRIRLRKALFEINTGFLKAGLLSSIFSLGKTESPASSDTPMSVQTSGSSSRQARPRSTSSARSMG